IVGPVALDEPNQLLLALARKPSDEVRERMGVRRDEVGRATRESLLREARMCSRPPLAGQSRVADMSAAEHADPQIKPPGSDDLQPLREAGAPGLAKRQPISGLAADLLGALRR